MKVGRPADLRLELLSDYILVVCPAAEALEKQCGSLKECGTVCFFGKPQKNSMKTHFNSIKLTDELTGLNTRWLGGDITLLYYCITVFFM